MKQLMQWLVLLLIASGVALGQCVGVVGGTQCVGPTLTLTANGATPPTTWQFNIGGTPPVGTLGVATMSTLNSELVVDFNKGGYFAIPTKDATGHLPLSVMPVLAESSITNLVADLTAKVATTKIGAVSGVAPLDALKLVPLANLPMLDVNHVPVLPESNITNLTADLASKVPATALGTTVATLDATGKIPLSQLPALGGGAAIPTSFSCAVAVINVAGTTGWTVNFSNCQ